MKTLLTTTAIALLASTPLLAQEATTSDVPPADTTQQETQAQPTPDAGTQDGTMQAGTLFLPAGQADQRYASDLLGMEVYSSQSDYQTYDGMVTNDARAGWDSIGSINDLVISSNGDVEGVLLDIGGFLGIGAHTVALDMDEVHFLGDERGAQFIAVNSTREQLENAPAYERADMRGDMLAGDPAARTPGTALAPATQQDMAATPADPAMQGTATDPATQQDMADMPADPTMQGTATTTDPGAVPMEMSRPAYVREGYQDVDYSQLTAEELQGATVYDGNDESIGSVGELLLSADGAIDAAIVDIGGFLGIGTHSVALDFDELQVMRQADGSDVRVYIDQTRENLEQRPAHEG